MNIRPLHDRVIVKRVEAERTTASGIVIPDSAGEKPDQGEVLAIGPGKRDDNGKQIALDVKVGDRVLFGKYAGQAVKVDGQEVVRTTVKRTVPGAFTASETLDVGVDLGSPVSLDYLDRAPFRFDGKIDSVTVDLK